MLVDTLSLARELRAADFSAGQAEALATAIGRSVTGTAASKSDLELAKQELRGDIERARNQLMLWFFSGQLALGGLIVAMLKL